MTHQRQQIKLADHVLSTLHNFTIRYSILLKDVRFDAIPNKNLNSQITSKCSKYHFYDFYHIFIKSLLRTHNGICNIFFFRLANSIQDLRK